MAETKPRENARSEDTGRVGDLDDSSLPCRGHLKKLFQCRTSRLVPPQHVIFSQGEFPHTLCMICAGMVKLTRTEADGSRVIVGTRQKGWMLGAVSVFQGTPYEVTAETITRSQLCFIPTEVFRRETETDAKFSRWISVILSDGLRASVLSISEQSCLTGRQRLEKFLLNVVHAQNGAVGAQGPVKLRMILKNWEVAQSLALTPQHLCRLIKQMEGEGVIARRNGWLIVSDPDRLRSPGVRSKPAC
jgi:CRP/FNR family transcriptional regulator, cyclic AMP receptor protein